MRYPLQRADQIRSLEVLAIVSPHILQDLADIQVAELVDHIAHKTRLADGLLDLAEALGDHLLAADNTRHRARHLA